MGFERQNIYATPNEAYRAQLEERLSRIKDKTWAQLTAEEKDLLSEAAAFKHGLVKSP